MNEYTQWAIPLVFMSVCLAAGFVLGALVSLVLLLRDLRTTHGAIGSMSTHLEFIESELGDHAEAQAYEIDNIRRRLSELEDSE